MYRLLYFAQALRITWRKEVIEMLEFVTVMAVIALVFCGATVFVALFVGGLFKARQYLMERAESEVQG